uniref:Uncharacterized protein n=1 Tax=Knipowitschia caucasica TaxID=637954 RepID=A0AAV2K0D1_KNICA
MAEPSFSTTEYLAPLGSNVLLRVGWFDHTQLHHGLHLPLQLLDQLLGNTIGIPTVQKVIPVVVLDVDSNWEIVLHHPHSDVRRKNAQQLLHDDESSRNSSGSKALPICLQGNIVFGLNKKTPWAWGKETWCCETSSSWALKKDQYGKSFVGRYEKPPSSPSMRAANGLNLPWVGYMVADFEIHGVRVPARGIVVAKDECIGADKAILGMNVITDCWEELFTQYKASPKHSTPPLSREWNTVFIDCQRIRAAANAEPWQATARLASRTPVTIPAQSEMTVWAKIPRPSSNQPGCALVEPLGEDGGVGVARALVTVRKARIPVRVRNVHPYALTLSRFQRLATVSAVDPDAVRDGKELSILNVGPGVVEVNLVDTADPDKPEVNETTNALPLSKGDGLTDDEQRQLNELLRRWSHVFSIHEEDYGRTGAVKHRIPTGDSNPIRERLPAPPDRKLAGEERLVGAVETMSMDSPPNSWRWDPERWRSLQNEDPDLQSIKEHVERGSTPNAQIIVCVLKEEMALKESSIATT